MPQSTLLLVDDDPDILWITRALFESEGYRVMSCASARDAADLFSRLDSVDLLVTDFQMPEVTGLELARELTALKPALPVLMVSGSILSETMEAEMKARQWRFVPKPARFPELLSCVRGMLNSRDQKIVGQFDRRSNLV